MNRSVSRLTYPIIALLGTLSEDVDIGDGVTIEDARPAGRVSLAARIPGPPERAIDFEVLDDPWMITTLRVQRDNRVGVGAIGVTLFRTYREGPPEQGRALTFAGPYGMVLSSVGAALLRAPRTTTTPLLEHPHLAFAAATLGILTFAETEAHIAARSVTKHNEERLAAAVLQFVGELRDALFSGGEVGELRDAEREEDGMTPWDAELVRMLDRIGAAEDAAKLREARAGLPPSKKWEAWLPGQLPPKEDIYETRPPQPSPMISAFARVVWRVVVQPKLELERRKPPALVTAIHEPVAHLLHRTRLDTDGTGQLTIPLPGELAVRIARDAAAIGATTLNAIMVNKGVRLFGSIASHRVLRDMVYTGHRQALEGNPDPRLYRFDGGWKQYAEHLGMPGKKAADQVRDIIEAMHGTEVPLPNGTHTRLLIREYHPPQGQRKGRILLTLGTCLLPDYVRELHGVFRGTLVGRRAARLVPVLPIPPLLGHEFHHGPQATFSMMLVGYFRDHAAEVAERGALPLPDDVLRDLADAAGLAWERVHPTLEHWLSDHEDGPALLARTPNGFTLGPAHKPAWGFILAGGKAELDGAAAGRKANAKRAARLKRQARGK